jgi:hypothetical protein
VCVRGRRSFGPVPLLGSRRAARARSQPTRRPANGATDGTGTRIVGAGRRRVVTRGAPARPSAVTISADDAPRTGRRPARRRPPLAGASNRQFSRRTGGRKILKKNFKPVCRVRRRGLAEFPVCDPQTGVARDPWVTEAAMCVRLVGVRITCGLHDIAQLAAIFIDPRAE